MLETSKAQTIGSILLYTMEKTVHSLHTDHSACVIIHTMWHLWWSQTCHSEPAHTLSAPLGHVWHWVFPMLTKHREHHLQSTKSWWGLTADDGAAIRVVNQGTERVAFTLWKRNSCARKLFQAEHQKGEDDWQTGKYAESIPIIRKLYIRSQALLPNLGAKMF